MCTNPDTITWYVKQFLSSNPGLASLNHTWKYQSIQLRESKSVLPQKSFFPIMYEVLSNFFHLLMPMTNITEVCATLNFTEELLQRNLLAQSQT